MHSGQSIQSDHTIELTEHFLHTLVAANVVARLEDVRGIEANAEPLRFPDILDNSGEMLEAIAETRSLAGRRFQRDLGFDFGNHRPNRVDGRDNLFDTRVFAGPK